jgi:hypothetical protein
MPVSLDDRALLTAGVLGVGVLVLLAWIAAKGGEGVGRAVGEVAAGAAVGAVKGVGDVVGLPDPADPVTHAEGEAALAEGDYLEASAKLPALEFLGSIGSSIGLALGEFVYGPGDARAVYGTPGEPKEYNARDPFSGGW